MELKKKRQKLSEDRVILNPTTLRDICDWASFDKTCVEHFDINDSCIKVTYLQLYDLSQKIYDVLNQIGSSQFIGIADNIPVYCVPVLMIGIISSGRAFVCLPSNVMESKRISNKLNMSHAFSCKRLSEKNTLENLEIFGQTIYIDEVTLRMHKKITLPANNIFAYATTTSGSTGLAKIVKVTHSSILPNIIDLKKKLELSEKDVIAQITPLTFDPSIIEIFLSLSSKACLLTVSENVKNDPEMFLKILVENKTTVLQSTPSLFLQRWSSEEIKENLLGNSTSLRVLLLGGENFPNAKIISRIKSSGNKTRIFNIYGITEVSCWATICEIEKENPSQNFGETLSETILEVRNNDGKKIDEGEGILYIGSDSRICVIDSENVEDLMKPVFRSTGDIAEITRNGQIKLKGRRDRRIKRYGTKVHLEELENHIQELPFVENCHALFTESSQSLQILFTVFEKLITEEEKKDYESRVFDRVKTLSDIYRPDNVILLDRFELTSNGKICKHFLRKYSQKPEFIKHDVSSTVENFEEIWKSFLHFEKNTGFLSSGGSSVIALRIVNEFENKIGRKFPKLVGLLLKNETLEFCQKYICTQLLAVSQKETNSEGLEKSPTEKKSNIWNNNSNTDEGRKYIETDSEEEEDQTSNFPWYKLRGQSNFPISSKIEETRKYQKFTKIRLKNRYNLGKCVDASPTIFQYPGGKEYVTVGSHAGIICTVELSNEDFIEHWQISLPNRIEASVLVVDDFKGIVGTYDHSVYCVNLKTGKLFWKFETEDIVKCTAVPCSKKKNIFFGSYDHNAYCASVKDGSKVWAVKISNGSICTTPCVDDESSSVLFATLDGTCVSLKQSSGEINWSYKSDYPIFSAPTILYSGISVFCDVSGKLCFLSLVTGEKIRDLKIDGNVFSYLHVHKDAETNIENILFASLNKNVYKLECFVDKSPIFKFVKGIDTPVVSTPFSDGNVIIVVSNDGNLRILDFLSGEIRFTFKLEGDVFSSPVINGDFIVVGCRDDCLYIFTRYDEN